MCHILPHITFRFYLIGFQLNADAFKKSKNPSAFVRKTIGSNNSFTLIENDFRFLR